MNNLKFNLSAMSHSGKCRKDNQDSYYLRDDASLFVLSDGMGGENAGKAAAAIACTVIPKKIPKQLSSISDASRAIIDAIDETTRLIIEHSSENPKLRGMGTTIIMGVVVGDRLLIAHLGDSRAYLLRNSVLERLTHDHTIGAMLLESGEISKDEYEAHPLKHSLSRYIGCSDCPPAEMGILRLCPADRIMFCSDGLTNMVDEQTIGDTLNITNKAQDACYNLVCIANNAGGKDNVTVIVLDIDHSESVLNDKVYLNPIVGESLDKLPQDIE